MEDEILGTRQLRRQRSEQTHAVIKNFSESSITVIIIVFFILDDKITLYN